MTDMIERVAKAMLDQLAREIGVQIARRLDDYAGADEHRKLARAAIEAMREPTPEMLHAAATAPMPLAMFDSRKAEQRARAKVQWRAAIDTALDGASMNSKTRFVSREEIEAARTPAGGWTKAQLAEWGVPWPPTRGWRSKLEGRTALDHISREG